MTKTFTKLQEGLALCFPHMETIGRKSQNSIDDLDVKGRDMMKKAMWDKAGEVNEQESTEERVEVDDIIIELL